MSGDIPKRIVRTEQDLNAPTGEGTIYVCADGSRWIDARLDGRTQGTGVQRAVRRGGYIQQDYRVRGSFSNEPKAIPERATADRQGIA